MPQSVEVISAETILGPDQSEPLGLARRALEAGRLDEAERLYTALLGSGAAADGYKGIGDVLLRQNRLPRAAQAYIEALKLRPDWPEAENNFGNVSKLRGNRELAERHYRRALSLNPQLWQASNNLGVMLAENGRVAEAAQHFRDALLSSGLSEARRNLATALFQLGQLEEARSEFERVLAADPKDADALVGLARLLRSIGEARQALELARKALQLRPGFGEAYLEAGEALLVGGDPEQALPYCRHAVEVLPNSVAAHEALGSALVGFGVPQEAEHHFRRAVALAPSAPSVLVKLGWLLEEREQVAEAEENYRAALKADPNHALAMTHLGNLALKRKQPAEALSHFERAVALQPASAAAHNNLATALNELGRYREAAETCRKAIAANPRIAEAHHNLGSILQTLGQLDESRRCYEKALELNPNMAPTLYSLSNLAADAASAFALPVIEKLLVNDKLPDESKAQLHFARLRLLERQGDHDAAFAAATAGNAIEARRQSYEAALLERLTAGIKQTFTADFFAQRRSFGAPAEEPIFIVGLPRSGTTLIEQVLASHPRVFGAGELPVLPQLASGLRQWSRTKRDFPHGTADLHEPEVLRLAGAYRRHTRELAGPGKRVTDKMPSNMFNLGLAALLFPRAKIIWCRRDPLDLFISNYFMLFRNPIPYTTDQRHFAHFYRLLESLLAHWREVLPIELLEVEYESFVGDQQGETRRLLKYCGLEWDPNCLDFHLNERPVRTSSDTQVRKPLYRTSLGRATPYRKHLQELEAALAGGQAAA